MSMFREYSVTLEEFKAMKRQTEEENYLQYGFTLAELVEKMNEDGYTVNDFAY